ncbi:MAG: glycosyltransferase [Cyanobacteria bacterium J06621_8]
MSDLGGGGAERVMLNLANGFAAKNIDVDLILVRKFGPYISQISPKVRVVNFKSPSLLKSTPLLVRYLTKEKPSILFSALEDTNIVAIIAKYIANVSTKVIVSVHNTLTQESLHAQTLKRKLVPYFIPWVYRGADGVVAVSNGVSSDLVKLGVQDKKITVIYNPIVTPEYQEKLQENFDHPWFDVDEPPVILAVGRLNQQKDFSTLIKAFAKVRQSVSAKLMILGEGEQQEQLELLAQTLGVAKDILLPGFVDNPYVYMREAKILVLSSAWEGFGNVLVEAMAAETMVISTDCPFGPAEILANGKYGKLVSVGNVDEMANSIISALQEVPNRDILKARAEEFSLDIAIHKYLDLFKIASSYFTK